MDYNLLSDDELKALSANMLVEKQTLERQIIIDFKVRPNQLEQIKEMILQLDNKEKEKQKIDDILDDRNRR
jgi:hypothetical protein